MVLRQQLDRLIADSLDVETFARIVLAAAWDEASTADQLRWNDTFYRVLRARYERWLVAPDRLDVRVLHSAERG